MQQLAMHTIILDIERERLSYPHIELKHMLTAGMTTHQSHARMLHNDYDEFKVICFWNESCTRRRQFRHTFCVWTADGIPFNWNWFRLLIIRSIWIGACAERRRMCECVEYWLGNKLKIAKITLHSIWNINRKFNRISYIVSKSCDSCVDRKFV